MLFNRAVGSVFSSDHRYRSSGRYLVDLHCRGPVLALVFFAWHLTGLRLPQAAFRDLVPGRSAYPLNGRYHRDEGGLRQEHVGASAVLLFCQSSHYHDDS